MLKTIFQVKAVAIIKQFLFKPQKKKKKKKIQNPEKELRSIFSVSCEQYMCKDKKHCLKKPRTYHR